MKPNGICLSFGWNTNGVGKKREFEIIEILVVAHGGSKNDTLCTVEKKTFTITTAVACKKLGITYVGSELSEKQCK